MPSRDHRDVPLEPLTLEEGRELALRLIGQDDVAAVALAEAIVRESGGSPYFVYELVEYLKEGGELGEGNAIRLDFSLDSACWRIARMPAEAVSLLEVLAVAGRPLRQAIACRAADLGALGFSGLALLRAQHLVRGTGLGSLDEVETYHDRIRETVVNHLGCPYAGVNLDAARPGGGVLEQAGGADPETAGRASRKGPASSRKPATITHWRRDEASGAAGF